jgi:membrane-associated phospholipid phosphatase
MLSSSPPAAGSGTAPARGLPKFLPGAVAFAGAGVLVLLAGVLANAFGADAAWMLGVHASAPTALGVIAWSCLTVAGLGWSVLILLLAADRRVGLLAALVVPTFILGGLLTHVPKNLLAAPRPAATSIAPHLHVIGRAFTGAVSMPSGHALAAGAAAALLCIVLARRPLARALILLAAALVAISRVVVGAHWPSDVLVGFGLGLLAGGLVAAAAASLRSGAWHAGLAMRLRSKAGQRVVAIVEVGAAAGLLKENTGYPAGTPMVWLLVALALASAVLRWRATLQPAGPALVQDTPAGQP